MLPSRENATLVGEVFLLESLVNELEFRVMFDCEDDATELNFWEAGIGTMNDLMSCTLSEELLGYSCLKI